MTIINYNEFKKGRFKDVEGNTLDYKKLRLEKRIKDKINKRADALNNRKTKTLEKARLKKFR